MNDAMSLGVHRLWKDAFVAGLNPGKRGAMKCLDVAGGTGDIALRILDHAREKWYDRETSVEVLDINPEMLAEGKKRFKLTMYHNSELHFFYSITHSLRLRQPPKYPSGKATHRNWTYRTALMTFTQLPLAYETAPQYPTSSKKRTVSLNLEAPLLASNSAGSITLSFLRAFSSVSFDIHLTFKPPFVSRVYDQYSFSILPLLGSILASDRASYQYLVESIRRFPPQEEFAQMIRDAGFSTGGDFEGKGGAWEDLWGGVACIHKGVKL